jgi:hypothetical protein
MSDVFQSLLGRGDVSFGAEDVAKLVAGFESALANLGLKDPNDPATADIARLIVQIAKDGFFALQKIFLLKLCSAFLIFFQPERRL